MNRAVVKAVHTGLQKKKKKKNSSEIQDPFTSVRHGEVFREGYRVATLKKRSLSRGLRCKREAGLGKS